MTVAPRAAGKPAGGGRVPALVLLACLAQLLLGLCWGTLQPSLRSLDEPAHVAGVLQLVYHHTWPAPDDLHIAAGLENVLRESTITDFKVPTHPVPRGQRPSLAAGGGGRPVPDQYSYMAQHPPLYYAVVATVVRLAPGEQHWQYDRLVALMRAVSAVMLLPVPALAWAAARRFTDDRRLALAAALAPLAVPGIARAGGSVSNDSLQILLTAALVVPVAHLLTGDVRTRIGVWIGALTLADLLTKGTALVIPVWLVLVVAWVAWRRRRDGLPLEPLGRPVLAIGAGTALGLVWWVRNVIAFGALQPVGAGQTLPTGPPASAYGHFVTTYLSAMSFRFWGSLGLPEPPQLDRTLCQVATYVVLGALLLALVAGGERRRRAGMVLLLLLLVGTLLLVAAGSLRSYRAHGTFNGVQGRYLYVAVTAVAVPTVIGLGAVLRGRLRALVPLGVAVVAVLLQQAAVRDAIRDTWTPRGSGSVEGRHVLLDYAPFAPRLTEAPYALLVLVTVAIGLLLLAQLRPRAGRR